MDEDVSGNCVRKDKLSFDEALGIEAYFT